MSRRRSGSVLHRARGLVLRALGIRALETTTAEILDRLDEVGAGVGELARQMQDLAEGGMRAHHQTHLGIDHVAESVRQVGESVHRVRQVASSTLDDIPALRRELRAARRSAEYERAFTEAEPLVSVRIATYNRSGLLVERAVTSAVNQTYEHIEIVVVGDCCTDDTAAALAAVGDPRIRFVNLPYRWPYPEHEVHRWLVAGSPAMNVATQLSQGLWIAPLDHDDEFLPDHVETLLATARAGDYELAYGQILKRHPDGIADEPICTFPPSYEHFGLQASVFVGALRFFEYNTKSWLLDEPGDWNLCRRMMEAGVRFGFVDKPVTAYYPSLLFRDAVESSGP